MTDVVLDTELKKLKNKKKKSLMFWRKILDGAEKGWKYIQTNSSAGICFQLYLTPLLQPDLRQSAVSFSTSLETDTEKEVRS